MADNNPDNDLDEQYINPDEDPYILRPGGILDINQNEIDNIPNDNNLYSIIGYALVIGTIYDLGSWLPVSSVTTPLASFLSVYALSDGLVHVATDFIEDLHEYEELVNLAKKITFLYLFGMLGIQDGGGNKLSNKPDKQLINDFTVAFNKLPQETKIKLKQLKKLFQNVFCMKKSINIGGVRKQKTNKFKNKRRSKRKGKK
jgi:hypothetical protein